MALMQTLQDSFPGSTLSALWGSYGTVAVSGGQCGIDCTSSYSGITSNAAYDLTGSYAVCKMTPYLGGSGYQCYLLLTPDLTNGYAIGYESGDLQGEYIVGGNGTVIGTLTYSATAHAWIRIREAAGTVYFDTAPDGKTWTNRWTSSEPVAITSLYAEPYTGHYVAGTDGTSDFASFNVLPGVHTGAAVLSGSGTLTAGASVKWPAAAMLSGSGSLTAAATVQTPPAGTAADLVQFSPVI